MMARSTYLYIVLGEDGIPIAGFTVKWELGMWLRRYPGQWFPIYRLHDGVDPKTPVLIDPDDARGAQAT